MSSAPPARARLLRSGAEGFAAMLAAIDAARESIRLETYIFSDGAIGRRMQAALLGARHRGVTVHVLVDAFGSIDLPDAFWVPLRQAGASVRWFNALSLRRWTYRDHRKLLVCDETLAIVGGFNVADEYDGDGIRSGWRDLGIEVSGPLARALARTFDRLQGLADFRHRRLQRLRRASDRVVGQANWRILSSGPGCRHGEIRRSLADDLASARHVRIASAYFLPTWRLRRELRRVVRRGGRVQLMLAGRTDVHLTQLAGRGTYGGLLRSGIEILEYQPQILHAKLVIIDDTVYVGSANLDTRSLLINYELLVRIQDPGLAAEAVAMFEADLHHCHRIHRRTWRKSRTWWNRLRERWAHFLLARLDVLLARWQRRALR